MSTLEIITTADGSHSIRNNDLNETYHSVHGAVQESLHVFLRNGLQYFSGRHQTKNISILEVGFGTGLNALLVWRYALENRIDVRYTTLEPFPLQRDVWTQLNYPELEKDSERFMALHDAVWGTMISLAEEFSILKIKQPLGEAVLDGPYDVVFFDAFAPSVQPELWRPEALMKVTAPLKDAGVFVTYSAKGQLKRDLKALGLTVETLPGPPGKNEMVRGVKTLMEG